jgi:hypothetical protein
MTEIMLATDPEVISRVVSEMGGDELDTDDAARE